MCMGVTTGTTGSTTTVGDSSREARAGTRRSNPLADNYLQLLLYSFKKMWRLGFHYADIYSIMGVTHNKSRKRTMSQPGWEGAEDICDSNYHDESIGHFSLSEIPTKGVRSIDLFDARGRRLFSVSVSTDGVAYQVLPAGEDAGIYTTSDDEI